MLLKELANSLLEQIYSFLHVTNFTVFLPKKLIYDGANDDYHLHDATSTFAVLALWIILYLIYKKFLNLMLRRMRYSLTRRNRLIEGLWCCGFSVCSLIFLAHHKSESQDHSCPWKKVGNYNLGFAVHKTFYLHRSTIQVFAHNHWLGGLADQLFATSLPAPSSQKWPDALFLLLFYKAGDLAALNFCKILLTLSRSKTVKRIAKLIFILHFFNWIYMHILLVPGSLLFHQDANRNWRMQASLWMWLICDLINTVRDKEFSCMFSKQQSLEKSVFPPPTQEVIEFVNILKKHRSCISNDTINVQASAQKQKTELWQTIVCAMTMKKRLKKLRETKRGATKEGISDSNKGVKNIAENI